jgi:hypothetical protein
MGPSRGAKLAANQAALAALDDLEDPVSGGVSLVGRPGPRSMPPNRWVRGFPTIYGFSKADPQDFHGPI